MQPDVRESSMQIRFEMKASCAHIPELSNGTIIAYVPCMHDRTATCVQFLSVICVLAC